MAIVGKVFAELELYKGLTYNISFGGEIDFILNQPVEIKTG